MKRLLHGGLSLAGATLLTAVSALGQGQPSSPAPNTSGTPSTSTNSNRTSRPSPTTDQNRGPLFVSGRVLSELGRPLSEPVSIELSCGMRAIQAIHTDLGGYFTFSLGGGAQSNIDFSASNQSPQSFNMNASSLPGQYSDPLAGCEIRVSVSGFRPMTIPMAHNSDLGRVDVGNINMERIGSSKGGGVSLTSLMIPKEAAKEYEKAVKDLQNNKQESALPHLEKAVSLYDNYAAAWNALGRLFLSRNLFEKAATAFEKSIAADPDFIPPLVSLASIQIQNREWEKGIDTAGKALALESDIGFASFLQAVGYFNLNKLDEAERHARRAADASSTDDDPQIHALLAQIYMEKQDYGQAAAQMRAYLKQSPNGQFAEKMKKDLADIEAWVGQTGEVRSSTSAEPGS